MYVQLNFGRNIKNVPMDILTWNTFNGEIISALYDSTKAAPYSIYQTTVEVHTGTGRWFDEDLNDYITEESCHVSFYDPAGFDLEYLRTKLRDLKARFGQDSIALITGSELI